MPVRSRSRRGFTLLEMIFGLFAMGVLGLAVAGMLLATGDAWAVRNDYRRQVADTRTVMANLTEWVRSSRRVVSAPVTDQDRFHNLVLWVEDIHFPDEVNLSELRILTWDRDQDTLTLYAAELSDAEKSAAASNTAFAPQEVALASFPAAFRARSHVGSYPMAENVTQFTATLAEPDAADVRYRLVELRIAFPTPAGGGSQLEVAAAMVRTPDYALDFGN